MTDPYGFRIILRTISQLQVDIKHESEAIILIVACRRAQPAFPGIPAAYGPALSFDQSDCRPLFVAIPMEVFEIPAVSARSIEKSHFCREVKVFDFSGKEANLVVTG